MDDETFNMSLRKFLKQLGVTSQQAIERHVRDSGTTSGSLAVKAEVTIEGTTFRHLVEGKIDLG